MIAELPPGLILIFGGLLVPLLPSRLRPFLMIILPFVAFAHLLTLPTANSVTYRLWVCRLLRCAWTSSA